MSKNIELLTYSWQYSYFAILSIQHNSILEKRAATYQMLSDKWQPLYMRQNYLLLFGFSLPGYRLGIGST